MVTPNVTRMISVFVSILLLTACSKTVTSAPVPEGGLTVSQLYQASIMDSTQSWSVQHPLVVKSAEYKGIAHHEIQTQFKPLDNPAIPIYIFPHVALIGDEQLIKPGYTTSFFLYKQNQFALASEQY